MSANTLSPTPEMAADAAIESSRENAAVFPASFAQQRLWFLQQFDPDSPLYNVSTPARLRGDLDIESLRNAIGAMVQRHESLRTTFKLVDRKPMQIIAPSSAPELPVIDLSGLPLEQREEEAKRLLKADMEKPFDLTRDSMLRVRLLRLGATEHFLSVITHHIVSDDWSMTVFYRELASFYDDFSHNRPASLPELPLQYADFSLWQCDWLQGEILDGQLEYWKEQLAGAPPLLEFPLDYPRPAIQSPQGAEIFFSLSKSLSESLKCFSQQEGCTMFMILLAAFKTLAARYTGEEDIVIGAPTGIRDQPELEGMIGCFVNTLVLRTDLSGNPTFRELLKRVRDTALDAYDHQETPLERIVQELNVPRHPGRNPLFQILFQYLAKPLVSLNEFGNLTMELLPVEAGTAKFDLTLSFEESPEGLTGSFEFSTDLFDSATIERMAGHFRTLLESIVRDPTQRIWNLPLLSPEEKRELIGCETNETHSPEAMMTVPALFEQQCNATPDAVAVIFEEQHLTYRELNDRANQLARYLNTVGVGTETLVGLCMERSLEMVIAVFGILKAGGAYVPLEPDYPRERLLFMMNDSRAPVLLTQRRLAEIFPPGQTKIICLDSDWEKIAAEPCEDNGRRVTLEMRPDAENLAYIIYTSGSTGQPKGVMISHAAICNHAAWMQKNFPIGAQDRVLQRTPFSFDVSVWEIFGPLLHGAQLVLPVPESNHDIAAQADIIAQQNITILQAVPSQLRALLDQPKFKQCGSLKYVLVGGEALPPELVARFHATLAAQLINAYGPTETTIDATWHVCSANDAKRSFVPIGKPVAHMHAYILDACLQPVPVGVAGELHLGGRGLARGYWHRPELTAEKFIPNPFSREPGARLYKTGDRVRYLRNGEIEFLGRMDHQVKIRGFRIELGEIEAALCAYPLIRQAVVVARENSLREKILVAYLVTDEGSTSLIAEARAHLKTKLPDYMVPSAFVRLETLPLTPNGKIDFKALPAPEFKPDESQFTPPRTPIEAQLAKIWSEVLGLEQVGIHDNFFDLGGHSLLATQVTARMRAVSGKDVPLRDFFQSPTVAGLGGILEKSVTSGFDPAIAAIKPLPRRKVVNGFRNSAQAITVFLSEINGYIFESSLSGLSVL